MAVFSNHLRPRVPGLTAVMAPNGRPQSRSPTNSIMLFFALNTVRAIACKNVTTYMKVRKMQPVSQTRPTCSVRRYCRLARANAMVASITA
jgi:hypothetical protein